MKKTIIFATVIFTAVLTAGCVRRVVTIDSNPQGAQVYFDRKLVGETPCEHEFLYYGGHHLELVKDGYENYRTVCTLKGPFYEYFPFSFFTEVMLPWELKDEHSFSYELAEGKGKKPVISPVTKPQESLPPVELEQIKFD
ncbi:MAG: PEGA domain-containing protein [Candidatus Omnitrophica bacterium]|nr:PEGA domain-containing protein [Candidatus Omnitrophota bacterium]